MLHRSTLQHKQVKSQKQHLKVLWGWGAEGPSAEGRHMGPRVEVREKQMPEFTLGYYINFSSFFS